MNRIFFDTNIVLDQLDSKRKGHSSALQLELAMEQTGAQSLCAWHSLSIIEYVARKVFTKEDLYLAIRGIVEHFVIPKTGTEQAREAFNYLQNDFEDAMQIATAIAGKAHYIVTNDKSGFSKSPIRVVTPEECATLLLSNESI